MAWAAAQVAFRNINFHNGVSHGLWELGLDGVRECFYSFMLAARAKSHFACGAHDCVIS